MSDMRRRAVFVVFAGLLTGPALADDVPAKLMPPAGTAMLGAYAAKGVQIYVCTAKDGTNAWTLKAPDAQLVDAKGVVFAKHYAGPTWEATDGSKIVGKLMETAPSPAAGAIPWLLLSAQSSGQGALDGVRFVQRIKTSGGVPDSPACPEAGAERRVPYAAEYVFYK
jgi:hypothetical protein